MRHRLTYHHACTSRCSTCNSSLSCGAQKSFCLVCFPCLFLKKKSRQTARARKEICSPRSLALKPLSWQNIWPLRADVNSVQVSCQVWLARSGGERRLAPDRGRLQKTERVRQIDASVLVWHFHMTLFTQAYPYLYSWPYSANVHGFLCSCLVVSMILKYERRTLYPLQRQVEDGMQPRWLDLDTVLQYNAMHDKVEWGVTKTCMSMIRERCHIPRLDLIIRLPFRQSLAVGAIGNPINQEERTIHCSSLSIDSADFWVLRTALHPQLRAFATCESNLRSYLISDWPLIPIACRCQFIPLDQWFICLVFMLLIFHWGNCMRWCAACFYMWI